MHAYLCKARTFSGTSYDEVWNQTQAVYAQIKKRTKRKPYVRSKYFYKDKIFFDFFFIHLASKREPDRVRRMKYFEAAMELVRNTREHPESMQNPSVKSEILHRFLGKTADGNEFYVQIKEHKQSGRKQLMSCFPKK